MKRFLVLALALTACGSKPTTDTTPPTGDVSNGGSSPDITPDQPVALGCDKEIAAVCGDGAEDGCLAGKTTVHVCVAADAQPGGPCSEEVMLECTAGQYDACTRNAAANHVCVSDVPAM